MTETKRRITVAIDAMGGDHAPQEIVSGALAAAAASEGYLEPVLVGPQDILEAELAKHDTSGLPVRCVNAASFTNEDEKSPALAARRKPDSSLAIATKLVKSGEADALLGATATGSLVTSALQYLGMIEGIDRPVIGGVLSSLAPKTVIFDLGVNMDCKPHHLLTFAIIGTVYAKMFLDIPNPTVALLNVGIEEGKGNRLVRQAYSMLKESNLNFIGNVEGNAVLSGDANVIVCDAFVGNCIFKLAESGGPTVANYFMDKMKKYPLINKLLKSKVKGAISSLASSDSLSGGLIWGIDGIVFKMHGSSKSPEVAKALSHARKAVEGNVISCVKTELDKIKEHINF